MNNIAERFEAAQVQHRGTIRTFAGKCVRQVHPLSREDVEQELLVVLYECCFKYDPNKGARFNTFVQQSFRNKIISLIRYAEAKKRSAEVVSLSEEAVQYVVDSMLISRSAEDLALMRMDIREHVSPEAAAHLEEMVA